MKLPKPKYDVSVIDKAQFLLQLVLGFILGNVAYSLVYSLIQLFENQKFMNSDEKVYTASVGIQILAALLSILLVHMDPLSSSQSLSEVRLLISTRIRRTI